MIKTILIKYYSVKSHLNVLKKHVTNSTELAAKMTSTKEEYVEGIVCQVSDIAENELKTFKLKDTEVLLVKQNSVISALGAHCTHYNAPLVKGALGNGRIRCPFHGACFSLTTGDIEEFPGFDSLPCHQVTVEGNNVKVKAKKCDLLSQKRIKPMGKFCPASKESVVVIGGGAAAAMCVETLRQEYYGGDITVICKEAVLPYDRPKCSKQLDLDINTALFRNDSFYEKYGINLVKGAEATAVDTVAKNVRLSNNTSLSYSKLFVATGNSPKKLNIPGVDLKNVFVMRNYDHASAINSALSPDKNMVIVGSGFIGMEVANWCVGKVKKITILMKDSVPFEKVLGKRIGAALLEIFKKKGVEFLAASGLKQINGLCGVENVELLDGTTITTDIVLLGVGSIPNTCFLKGSGITLETNGTISTNSFLESNVPDVYVGGDIAFAPVWSNNNERAAIGHFGLAHYHGKVAGLNIAGKKTELKIVPYFWTALDGKSIRYCGHSHFDDIIYTGDVEQMKFVALYTKCDDVVAISSCMMDPYVSKYAELVAQGRKLHKKDISGCDPLAWAK